LKEQNVVGLSRRLRIAVAGALSVALVLPVVGVLGTPAQAAEPEFKALVFSKTAGYRHASIPTGVAAIKALGEANGFAVDATEDAASFTDANLDQYDVVVWLSTTGDVLDDAQQGAFERYIEAGGGYAGIHAAADTEYDWPWYGKLVGSYFDNHPAQQNVTVKTEDQVHPSTAHLPALATRFDELYAYRTNPRDTVHVLQSYDESTYNGGTMGSDHPITWCQDYEGGRSWYTGQGHTDASFADPAFRELVLGGIETAAGVLAADCTATQTESFDKVTLDDGTQNPMDLAPAPDGRVFYLERDGRVQVIKPGAGTVTAGRLNVTLVQEFGLAGIELAPDFETSNQLYLFWSPAGSSADRVSRFTMNGDTLDLSSEKVVLEVPVQRSQCCHVGGAMQFDTAGDLFVATGDNSNPFASDGYAPIDERAGRSAWDAQRSSGNTNSLSGKVLRITPQADGTYTVPAGNLFAPGTEKTRPEIYAMGFRNPYKIGLDPRTDTVLVGEYGPDAGSANANRGPAGTVEWNALTKPGNYGWPYCIGANTAYNDFDFTTNTSGARFDCANGPTNDSPNNTGLTKLPPAIPAAVWYSDNGQTNSPEIGGGGAPMGGSVYTYDPDLDSQVKWPAYYDGKAMFGEWNTGKLFSFQLEDDTSELTDINRILQSMEFKRPHALEWGADGALYIIEWGSGFGGDNADSGVYRIEYVSGNRSPIARLSADKTSGLAPLAVSFDSRGSRDPDGGALTVAWDFGDGGTSTEAAPTHTYTEVGNYNVVLTVTDPDGKTGTASQAITVGNTMPVITVAAPPDGAFFEFDDLVNYKVAVTDPEDGAVDCNDVIVQPALGHDEHAHPYQQYRGCEGSIPVPGDQGHVGADIFGVITVTYTDKGAPGVAPLTAQKVIVLQPKHKEAEYFADTGRLANSESTGTAGVQTQATSDTGGGLNLGYIEKDDWFSIDPTNLENIEAIRVRAAASSSGTLEIRTGSPTGPALGAITVATGGWQNWRTFTIPVPADLPRDSGPLYVVDTAGGYNVNWLEFVGKGVSENQRPNVEVSASPTTGLAPQMVQFTAVASDPEGDEPLTYAWTFGDGATSNVANPKHIYTRSGKHTARLVVTDARGGAATSTIDISIRASSGCLTGRSDDFYGTSLDRDKWEVVRENADLRVQNGALALKTANGDINGTNTSAPNIVLTALPEGPFEVTTMLTAPQALQAYQQAGLIIYGDDNNYIKNVIQGRTTASPNAATRIFQYSKETAGVGADTNSAAVGAAFPGSVWLRLSSPDGVTVTGSYSTDGITFTEMAATKTMAGIVNPRVGFFAVQGNRGAQPTVDAKFDYIHITPDDTATERGVWRDDFTGGALSRTAWPTVVRETQDLQVDGGALVLPTSATDITGAEPNNTSNLVLRELPGSAFAVTTKVTLPARRAAQQAGLLIYGDDDNYAKLVLAGTADSDDAASRLVRLTTEKDGLVTGEADNVSGALGSAYPDTVYLRLTSTDGITVHGAYSADGVTFTELPESVSLAGMTAVKAGMIAQQGAGRTATPIDARFDWVEIVDTSVANLGTDDEFAGDVLNGCRWSVVRPDLNRMRVSDGRLELDTTPGDIYRVRTGAGPRNFVVQDQPAGNWTIETKIDASAFSERYQQGGLIAYVDDTTYVKLDFVTNNVAGNAVTRRIEIRSEIDDVIQEPQPTVSGLTQGVWYLRLTKSGSTFTGSYSADGSSWLSLPSVENADVAESARVGLFTLADASTINAPAKFDYFRDVTDRVAPTVTGALAPVVADGADGWYTRPVAVVLAGADDSADPVTVDYRVDGGPWARYLLPVVVSADGEHTVDYRATDATGNVSQVGSSTFKIDATAPAVTVTGVADGETYGDSTVRTLAWTATDATSGVAATSATLDGAAVTSGTELTSYEMSLGEHTLAITSTDKAGNVTTVTTTFTIDTSLADVDALIGRFHSDGTISEKTTAALRYSLDRARDADARGSEKYTIVYLEQFIDRVKSQVKGDDRDLMVKALFLRDAEVLLARTRAAEDAENAQQ
jgi:PKD repeat protein/glucose/arabinose dehydrogenase